jgi:dipeptidyl aminopeptidase/acylaminoacyl peptidase
VSPRGQVYATAPLDQDKEALFTYDPERDALSPKPVMALDGFDLAPSFIENDEKLLGIRFVADALVTQWLDADMQSQQDAVDMLLPATVNVLTPPRRGDLPYLLVYAFSDVSPGGYYVFNRKTGKLTLLGSRHPNVKPDQMAAMDMVRFPARDGLEIPAYLTLPRGEKKTQFPLIVLVHGGPWVRGTEWGWDPEVQFLASRGYAVIQPEFRGSTGFGKKHFRAGFKQWGLAMQNDLADTARWAVAQGIADPKRICIMGASYGGYAAMMGLVNDPDLFRCAVNWVGVTEVDLFYNWGDLAESPAFKAYGISALIGDREKDAEQLRNTSPLQQAARIKNPVLMAYGGADRRVPLEHGKRMLSALKRHNSQAEWIEYEKEGHGWATIETQRDFWGRVEIFLATHLRAP